MVPNRARRAATGRGDRRDRATRSRFVAGSGDRRFTSPRPRRRALGARSPPEIEPWLTKHPRQPDPPRRCWSRWRSFVSTSSFCRRCSGRAVVSNRHAPNTRWTPFGATASFAAVGSPRGACRVVIPSTRAASTPRPEVPGHLDRNLILAVALSMLVFSSWTAWQASMAPPPDVDPVEVTSSAPGAGGSAGSWGRRARSRDRPRPHQRDRERARERE